MIKDFLQKEEVRKIDGIEYTLGVFRLHRMHLKENEWSTEVSH